MCARSGEDRLRPPGGSLRNSLFDKGRALSSGAGDSQKSALPDREPPASLGGNPVYVPYPKHRMDLAQQDPSRGSQRIRDERHQRTCRSRGGSAIRGCCQHRRSPFRRSSLSQRERARGCRRWRDSGSTRSGPSRFLEARSRTSPPPLHWGGRISSSVSLLWRTPRAASRNNQSLHASELGSRRNDIPSRLQGGVRLLGRESIRPLGGAARTCSTFIPPPRRRSTNATMCPSGSSGTTRNRRD